DVTLSTLWKSKDPNIIKSLSVDDSNPFSMSDSAGFIKGVASGTTTIKATLRIIPGDSTGELTAEFPVSVYSSAPIQVGQWPRQILISPDGKFLLVVNYESNTVSLIEVNDSLAVKYDAIPVGKLPMEAVITSDSKKALVVNYSSHNVTLVDLSIGDSLESVFLGQSYHPSNIAMTSDDAKAYVTSDNSGTQNDTLSVIDLTKTPLEIIEKIRVPNAPSDIVICEDVGKAYITSSSVDTVVVVDIENDTLLARINAPPATRAIKIPNSNYIIAIYSFLFPTLPMSIIDMEEDKVIRKIPVGEMPIDVAFLSDGSLAYVLHNNSENITILDVNSLSIKGSIENPSNSTFIDSRCICATPDGSELYVSNHWDSDNNITIIDVEKNVTRGKIPTESGPSQMVILPGGGTLCVINDRSHNLQSFVIMD
ncbi:MAG: YncE family protein, partial [Candidatus Hodarchaeota archaeon]